MERLSNLIAIFQKPELDFSKNRAEHDDILGDACEYLMQHFASESGESKGQFYAPSEVSRIIAKIIGISPANAIAATTAYDPDANGTDSLCASSRRSRDSRCSGRHATRCRTRLCDPKLAWIPEPQSKYQIRAALKHLILGGRIPDLSLNRLRHL